MIIFSTTLTALSLVSALRLGPLPAFELPPDVPSTFYLQRHLVNTAADPALSISATSPTGLKFELSQPLRALTLGPAPAGSALGNLHSIEIKVRNAEGETALAVLPVIVRSSSTPDIILRYRPETPIGKVVAAGDFNGWDQNRTPLLDPDGDGTYEARMQVAAGRYAYKFVVDGKWIPDPSNQVRTEDGFGGENTILVVEGAAPPPRLVGRTMQPGVAVVEFLPVATGAAPAAALALADGIRLNTRWNGSLLSIDLPQDGKDHLVKVYVADERGGLAGPLRFHTRPDLFHWEDAVLYFAFIDRFANGDPINDDPLRDEGLALQANYQGGDFAGLRRKIDEGYFDRLGVNAIWISPFFENPDRAYRDAVPPNRFFSGYHGYWPISERIEPRFGTEEELKSLVDAAHARGIKVLFDMVYNHVHEDHPMIKAHPEWIVPLDLPDGRKNIRQWNEYPLTTWFDDFLPDINYGVPEATAYQLEFTERVIRSTGVDGFRLDAVKHVPHPFWWALRRSVARIEEERGQRFYMVGETIDSRKKINEFVSAGGMDGQFDFPLHWTIRSVFAQERDGFDRVEAELAKGEREYSEDAIHCALLGNHDVSRFMAYAEDVFAGGSDEKEVGWNNPPAVRDPASYERIKMGWTFLFAIPQMPMIYYGDEFGMSGAHDPDNRRMMRFGDQLTEAERGVVEHVERLGEARRAHPALRYGVRRPLLAERDRYAFLREHFGDAAVAVWNRSGASVEFQLDVAPEIPDGTVMRDVLDTSRTATVAGGRLRFTLPPRSSSLMVTD